MSTNIVDQIAAKVAALPVDQQKKILEMIESLEVPENASPARRSVLGDLEHLGICITSQDIEEARGEMWRSYMGNHE